MSYRYTVAVCHLNMVETVEESLTALLDLTDDRFEILVIDDGSTDGSREVLAKLERDHERLVVVDDDNHNIASARNSSVEHASGDVVFHQLDADDRYLRGLRDFARLFEALEAHYDRPVYLRGRNVHLARRETLRSVPYRDVGYGEDLDLWRRMTASDDVEMVWLNHRPVREQIGYGRDILGYIGVRYSTVRVQFRTGIRPASYVRCMVEELLPWGIDSRPWYGAVFHLLVTPLAYLSVRGERLEDGELPPAYRDYCRYRKHVIGAVTSVPELREAGVDIAPEDLDDPEVFVGDLPPASTVPP
jgi:glycosyltransferase involved in cell wall biosynthesis